MAKKLPEERYSDGRRLREIIQAITQAFSGSDLENISTDMKVTMSFQTEKYPIYRRFNPLKSVKIEGYWWKDEDQKLQLKWNGFGDVEVRNFNGSNRIWVTRTFLGGWWYIREGNGDWVDIEAQTYTKCKGRKGQPTKSTREWVTCSVPKYYFKSFVDTFLEEQQDCCIKHKSEGLFSGEEDY